MFGHPDAPDMGPIPDTVIFARTPCHFDTLSDPGAWAEAIKFCSIHDHFTTGEEQQDHE